MSVNREEVCIHYSSEQIETYHTKFILVHKEGSHQTCIKSSQVAASSEFAIACTYHTTIKLPVIKACDPHLYRPSTHPFIVFLCTRPCLDNEISSR